MSTKIEWADIVWNPVTGCTKISEGCKNCYAEKFAKRLQNHPNIDIKYKYRNCFKPTFHPEELSTPGKWKTPKKVFVCSMGDLFHEDITHEQRLDVFEAMADNGQHTYILLTKRPQQMKEFFSGCEDWNPEEWPHVWIGVTVENQKAADERIPVLLQIPAKVRFISVEPMLKFITLNLSSDELNVYYNSLTGEFSGNDSKGEKIDWVICGGESGHGARPMHPDWVRYIRNQCEEANVPFFFKGWGEFSPSKINWITGKHDISLSDDGGYNNDSIDLETWRARNFTNMYRVGKKISGRLIDGKEYLQFPKTK